MIDSSYNEMVAFISFSSLYISFAFFILIGIAVCNYYVNRRKSFLLIMLGALLFLPIVSYTLFLWFRVYFFEDIYALMPDPSSGLYYGLLIKLFALAGGVLLIVGIHFTIGENDG